MPITDEATLRAIVAAYNARNWPECYRLIHEAITETVVTQVYNPTTDLWGEVTRNVPRDGVDLAAWLWVKGAREVNTDQGPFAEYIRAYTQMQYDLRNGEHLDQDGQIQGASDLIAPSRQVASSVLANFKQVVKEGDVRIHPMVARMVDPELLKKMGAVADGGPGALKNVPAEGTA